MNTYIRGYMINMLSEQRQEEAKRLREEQSREAEKSCYDEFVKDRELLGEGIDWEPQPVFVENNVNKEHRGRQSLLDKDRDAYELVESKPYLLDCEKMEIKKELMSYSIEFKKGFDDWWRTQNLFKKGRGGRPKKK